MSDKVIKRLEASVEDNSETGVFRCRRSIFTDLELFELEMKHIWEGTGSILLMRARSPTTTTTSPATSAASRSSSRGIAKVSFTLSSTRARIVAP
jgi:hypothetical protein